MPNWDQSFVYWIDKKGGKGICQFFMDKEEDISLNSVGWLVKFLNSLIKDIKLDISISSNRKNVKGKTRRQKKKGKRRHERKESEEIY